MDRFLHSRRKGKQCLWPPSLVPLFRALSEVTLPSTLGLAIQCFSNCLPHFLAPVPPDDWGQVPGPGMWQAPSQLGTGEPGRPADGAWGAGPGLRVGT